MEVAAIFLPLLAAFIAGFFGRLIGDRGSQIVTAGAVLVSALLSIVLTLRSREGVRRQNISNQVSRRRDEVVAIRKVPTRGGI
jgi:NADH:ubiquinone oxidoreductase subunit 5 (subunit L)/multisubunit Na+/H+ antiporter MnhA subunit